MIWAMLLAYSSFAACCAAQSSPDRDVYDENSASPYAHVEQTVDSHFQLYCTKLQCHVFSTVLECAMLDCTVLCLARLYHI